MAVGLRGCYLCVQSSCSFCRPISLSLSSRLDLVLRYFALVLFFVYYFFLYDVRLLLIPRCGFLISRVAFTWMCGVRIDFDALILLCSCSLLFFVRATT